MLFAVDDAVDFAGDAQPPKREFCPMADNETKALLEWERPTDQH
ncbi:uncharacterized protein METZ01_LOCUS37353 [marine metagenome]|uniref:Uncharacterized protein n=1 Tax=marine metagenome TaxID=408172 RepID=A0A381R0U9_9ZZZZ